MLKKNNKYKPLGLSEKITLDDSDLITEVKYKKRTGFGTHVKGKEHNVKILPSHRIIYEHYKDTGFKSLAKAIRKTDVYSEGVATRPNVITKSKSWQALMDEKLPEMKVAQRHSELLDKRDYIKVVGADGKVERVDDGPNTAAVSKGIELAYRLRGAFKEKEAPPASTVMYNLFYKPEVRDQMKVFEEGIKQSLKHEVARKYQAEIDQEEENRALLDGENEE